MLLPPFLLLAACLFAHFCGVEISEPSGFLNKSNFFNYAAPDKCFLTVCSNVFYFPFS